jgi:hypothetical protein
MPYVSPQADWMPGKEALNHICRVDGCSETNAISQLRSAISDRAVGARVQVPKAKHGEPWPSTSLYVPKGSYQIPSPNLWAEAEILSDGAVKFDLSGSAYQFEVIRENVLRLWPDRSRSTIASEQRCLEWFIRDLRDRGVETVSKTERRQFAKCHFGISVRGFDRVWRKALDETGLEEKGVRAGRKRK